MAIKIIHTKNLKWVDVVNPDEQDFLYLKDNFKFHPLDFEDVIEPSVRTKIDEYPEYHFLIMLFPYFDRARGEIQPAEVDFFIGKDFLVTIHHGKIRTLVNLSKNVSQFDNVRMQYLSSTSGFLVFSILEMLFKRSFPILDHMNQEIQTAESDAFQIKISTPYKLARIKKNIINYRRVMKMHKFVIQKLIHSKRDYLVFKDSKLYYQNLLESAENIWDVLASDKETIESYEETNQSLAGHKMNDILRILTIFSVIILMLTLIINLLLLIESVSIIHWTYLLPATFACLAIITIFMTIYFKKRRWL